MALNTLNHNYGQPLVVSSLNVTGNEVIDGNTTVLGSATLASASIGAVSAVQIQYLSTTTSDIQTQLNNRLTQSQLTTALTAYAPLAGATFTGAISATSLTLSTTPLAVGSGGSGLSATTKGGLFVGTSTSAFTNLPVGTDTYLLTADSSQTSGVKWAAAPVSLPSQTGQSGNYLTTNGTTASWATIQALPTQTGNNGNFLTTNGTSASWATLTASNLSGGTLSSTILGNSTVYIGSTAVALNRSSANLALTGITSVAFPGSTSGTITVQAAATAGTNTITLPAATGTVDLQGNTFYVGTTQIANNRASASQTLTGVSIDGNAATATSATTAGSVTNGLTTSNYSSYALPLSGGTLTGLLIGKTNTGGTLFNSLDTGSFSVRGDNSNACAISFHRPGNYAIQMGLDTDNVFKIGGWSASQNIFNLSGGGNLTLGGTLTINSDRRLKSNITKIENALDKVNAISGYTFDHNGEREAGVIAQEVLEVLPEVVRTNPEGMHTVAYQNMIGLLIEAVKEQSAKIASLEEQVKELKD